jgi:hypothetical protein
VGEVARSRSIKGAIRSSLRTFTFDSEGSDLLGCGSVAPKIDPQSLAEQPKAQQTWRLKMSATLKLTHKAIGVEIRRGTFDVVVDGERVGSLEMNDTIEIPIEAGHHTLQVRNGRNLSRTLTFDAAEGQVVAFRCTGKRFLPIFLVSFVVPRLALSLRPE